MKKISSTNLFYIVFIFDVILNLIPTWKSSFVTRFMPLETYSNFVITVSKTVNTFFFLLILLTAKKKNKGDLFLIILLMSIWALCSIMINLNFSYLFSYVGLVVTYLGLFCVKDYKFSPSLLKIASYLIIIWSISSVLYLPFASGEHYVHLFNTETENTAVSFCGWGTHRNHYAFYASLSILLLFLNKNKTIVRVLLTIPLLIGLFLSGCRTALLATFIVLFYLAWNKTSWKQRLFFMFLMGIAVYAIFYMGNALESRIISTSNDDRDELLYLFKDIILANPIFGTGSATMAFSGSYPEGSPCHNFLMQTAADFGVPMVFFFLIFLFLIFKSSTKESKVILLFLVLFGLAQPYFTFNCPIQFTLIAYLLIVYYNNLYLENTDKKPSKKRVVHEYAQ